MTDLSAAFVHTLDFGYARGARAIKDLSGCYEMTIDDHWWAAINPHEKPMRCSKDENGGAAV